MLDFIIKYWVEFLLGICAIGITTFFKSVWKMYLTQLKNNQKELCDTISQEIKNSFEASHKETMETYEQSKKDDEKLQEQIDVLKKGVLSIQGKQFREECERLLEEGYSISLEEFQDLDTDHQVYNNLGGNHKGDSLFDLVKKKAENNLTK